MKRLGWALALLALAFPAAAVGAFRAVVAVTGFGLAHFTATCAVVAVLLLASCVSGFYGRRAARGPWPGGWWR